MFCLNLLFVWYTLTSQVECRLYMSKKRNVVWRIPSSGKIEENRSLRVFVTQIKVGAYCWTPSPLKLQFLSNLRQKICFLYSFNRRLSSDCIITKYKNEMIEEKFIMNLSKLLRQINWFYFEYSTFLFQFFQHTLQIHQRK